MRFPHIVWASPTVLSPKLSDCNDGGMISRCVKEGPQNKKPRPKEKSLTPDSKSQPLVAKFEKPMFTLFIYQDTLPEQKVQKTHQLAPLWEVAGCRDLAVYFVCVYCQFAI